MKKTKIAAVALATLLAATPLASCGPKGGDENTLNIIVSNLGFGTDWLEAISTEFERIEGVEVEWESTINHANMLTQLETGYDLGADILMFAGVSAIWETMRLGLMTNINDVWNSTPDGETQTIAQKVHPAFAELYKMIDNNYYSMPFITETSGMAYNETTLDTLLGKGNWALPRTTNELTALAQRVKDAGGYGFTWVNKENAFYWGGATSTWAAQYDGIDFANHRNKAEIWDETQQKYVVDVEAKALDALGYHRAYEIESKYALKSELGGYSHQYCTSMEFMESQAAFAGTGYGNDDKLVAFTPNGNWLYQESMQDIEDEMQDIGMMGYPIISSIVEKFENYPHPVSVQNSYFKDLDDATKAQYDAMLIDIITYINAGKTGSKPTGIEGFAITDNDIAYVESAMQVATAKDQAHAFIPTYVKPEKVALAKKFLTFFASDYAGQLYGSVTHGFNPFYIKMDDDNKDFYVDFDYDSYNILNKTNWIMPYSKVGFYFARPVPEAFFDGAGNNKYKGDPDLMFADLKAMNMKIQAGNTTVWEYRLRQAGLVANGDI